MALERVVRTRVPDAGGHRFTFGSGYLVAPGRVLTAALDQVIHSGRSLADNVLGMVAYFAAEDIPRWLLEPPAIDGEATLGGGDPLAVDLALVGLSDYSLISLEADTIGLHRPSSE